MKKCNCTEHVPCEPCREEARKPLSDGDGWWPRVTLPSRSIGVGTSSGVDLTGYEFLKHTHNTMGLV